MMAVECGMPSGFMTFAAEVAGMPKEYTGAVVPSVTAGERQLVVTMQKGLEIAGAVHTPLALNLQAYATLA